VGFWAVHYRRKPPENSLHPPENALGEPDFLSGSAGHGFHSRVWRVRRVSTEISRVSLSIPYLSLSRISLSLDFSHSLYCCLCGSLGRRTKKKKMKWACNMGCAGEEKKKEKRKRKERMG